ncbi:hypothetical protein [Desulfocicer niacini]
MNKKIDISEDWVKSTIQDFISTSPLNTMKNGMDAACARCGCPVNRSSP